MTDETREAVNAEIARMLAEGRKFDAETSYTRMKTILLPFTAGAAFATALVALSRLIWG
jgi:hypothetical protein